MENANEIYVAFHIGRGGRFYDAGHTFFIGEFDFQELINRNSNDLFLRERDKKGRFCKPCWVDLNSHVMVEPEDMDSLSGRLEWDGLYNTDYVKRLDDCDEFEIEVLLKSDHYKSPALRACIAHYLDD